MSDTKWRKWEIAGLFAVLIFGNLLHFVYGWTGRDPVAAAFAAANESTWEHMKLLAAPWIVWSFIEAIALRGSRHFSLATRAAGLLAGLAAIPTLFYTYVGISGRVVDVVNILIFQAAVLLAFLVSYALQKRGALNGTLWQAAGGATLIGIGMLFVLWTYRPPMLPLFTDPVTGGRGLAKK